MKLCIGSGGKPVAGFINIDPRPLPGVVRGHAHQLPAGDGTVEVIFSHAVFEHLFLAHQIMALHEWGRVLAPDGVAIALGLPDFETIARLYLDRTEGTTRTVFDLMEVYRYTHGCPESHVQPDWQAWSPMEQPDSAPEGWLPFLHKALFDAAWCHGICEAASGLATTVIRYCYATEHHPVNLGIIAGHRPSDPIDALRRVPGVDDYVRLDTVEVV